MEAELNDGKHPPQVCHLDEWNILNRQVKFIVNSARVYEYFGLQWTVPLWDRHFAGFWYALSPQDKIEHSYYDQFLINDIFKPHNVDFRKERPRGLNTSSFANILVNKLPGILSKELKLRYRKRKDGYNYSGMIKALRRKMKAPRRDRFNLNVNYHIARYLLETRYDGR